MLIYAGIDEAGYGPMIGPLCVAGTAFVVSDHDPNLGGDICDLWKRLNKAVCRKRTDKRRRIAIDDSKKLKLPNDSNSHPLTHLERGVLGFANAMRQGTIQDATPGAGERTECDDGLFRFLTVQCGGAPWYQSTTPLPVAHSLDELRIAASRLKRTMQNEGVACSFMRCEAIDADSFNRQVDLMGTKSSVNFCAVMRLVDSIWRQWPKANLHVVVDRQGGRTHYLRDLMVSYPDAQAQILEETDVLSQYRLEHHGSTLLISFCVEAERSHLPVALASMTAKYVRELFMIRLNRYFQSLMPELKATAGYTEDARRYLTDIDGIIKQAGIERNALVRSI